MPPFVDSSRSAPFVNRSTALSLTLAVIVLAGTLTIWTTSSTDRAPAEHPVEALDAPATVRWQSSGTASVRVATPGDAVRSLGFIHGMRKAWTMLLWRQTALGDVSGWFGPGTIRLDRHIHRLGIPHTSQRAYLRLPDSSKALLERYTAGVNAAFATSAVRSREELVSLGVSPERWQPWHTLAVERLFAWLCTTPLSTPNRLKNAERDSLRAFLNDDHLLRAWLHVHGLENSIAWARMPSAPTTVTPTTATPTTATLTTADDPGRRPASSAQTSTALTTRLVTGTTATPIVQDVAIVLQPTATPSSVSLDSVPRERVHVTGATLPGTPFFLAGTRVHTDGSSAAPKAAGTAWSFLPGSPARMRRVAVDSSQHEIRYVRLSPRGADETLVAVPRHAGRLPLTVPPPSSSDPRDGPVADSIARGSPSRPSADTVLQSSGLPGSTIVGERSTSVESDRVRVDSVWVLDWPGQEAVSDVEAWRRIGRGAKTASLTLQDGVGLHVDVGGRVRVLGSPPERAVSAQMTVIGRVEWSRSVAASIHHARALSSTLSSREIVRSDSSVWAGVVADQALPALRQGAARDSVWFEARAYLQNWDFTYDRSSIGASIFETWMREYEREVGRFPLLSPSGLFSDRPTIDTTAYFAAHRYRRSFRRAVDRLRQAHGDDLRQWRWEEVVTDERSFPVFAADSLVIQDLSTLASTRYAPIPVPAQGHPSTPMGGPSMVNLGSPRSDFPSVPPTLRATTTWTGWTAPGRSHLIVQRPEFNVQQFFSRPFLRRSDRSAIPLAEPSSRLVDKAGDPSTGPSPSEDPSKTSSTRLIPSDR